MKKKIEILTGSGQKLEDLVVTIEKDNEELRAKNSEFEKQNGDYLVIVSTLNESRANLERELRGGLQILEMLETSDSLEDLLLDWEGGKDEDEDESKKKNLVTDRSEKDENKDEAAVKKKKPYHR